ncbi:uncharacterized protein [Pocillopora verrucosa]|uniref:uncharacterized protein isoform X1 n=2 Tax=Pocillopora verrucosa TaxID=203993 RepID=UPI002797C657|nr:uncharacterized protein LOC131789386 isoform X1 [Pocillopora verrucosa]
MAFGLILMLLTSSSIVRTEASAETGVKNYTIFASLGEMVEFPSWNISQYRQTDYFILTSSEYRVRIQKLSSDGSTQSCIEEAEWYKRCRAWVNMTYLGNDMAGVKIIVGNESMGGVFRVYLYCTGGSGTCSSDPLMEVHLVIRDKAFKTNASASVVDPTQKTKNTSAQLNRGREAKSSVPYTPTIPTTQGLQLPESRSKKNRNGGLSRKTGVSALLQAVLLFVMAVLI